MVRRLAAPLSRGEGLSRREAIPVQDARELRALGVSWIEIGRTLATRMGRSVPFGGSSVQLAVRRAPGGSIPTPRRPRLTASLEIITCPRCGALAGEQCASPDGWLSFPHKARVLAARAGEKAAPGAISSRMSV